MRTTAAGCLRARSATQRNATGSATATRRHEQAPYCRSHLPASDGDRVGAVAVFDMVSPRGWLGSRVVSVLDSGAEGPGFKMIKRATSCTVHTATLLRVIIIIYY